MAYRHKLGTCNQPIEILDSDDESQTLGLSSFIDLTQDEQVLPAHPPILQQSAIKKKDSSAVDRHSHHREPPELASQEHLSTDGQTVPTNLKNEEKILPLSSSPTLPIFHTTRNSSIRQSRRPSLEDDADSELSNIMDRLSRRRLRRERERNSDETYLNLQTSRNLTARSSSFEPAGVEAHEAHNGSITNNAATSTTLLSSTEEVLQSIRRDMGNFHAVYVKNQLQSASKRCKELQAGLPDFSDAVDPFSEMPAIHEKKANSVAKEQITNVDEDMNGADDGQSQIPERLPRYKHYITITRSFLVPDNHKLSFEPFLGDDVEGDTEQWLENLREAYDPPENEQASRKREYLSRLKMYLPEILERLKLDREDVLSYVIDTGLVAIGPPKAPLALLLAAFKNVFGTEIGDVFPEYEEYLKESKKYPRGRGNSEEKDPLKKLLQPHLLSCPVCHVYLCGVHGVYESDDSDDEGQDEFDKADESYADMNMSFESMIHRHKKESAHAKPTVDSIYKGEPCGLDCFLISGQSLEGTTMWNDDDTSYFAVLFLGMQSEPRAACILAPLMERPCYDVQKFIVSLGEDTTTGAETDFPKCEKLDWYDNERKKIRPDVDLCKKTNTHLHDQNQQPTGCEHLGISCFEAGEKCSCKVERILCDKFCACPDDCYMRFTGCACQKGHSPCSQESSTCPCVLLGRECDPDLCQHCGAEQTVNPFISNQNSPPNSCCNTDIQRGSRKRLIVGESSHPGNIGFGAYMGEPAEKGEFIAEYVGEIISYAECARRYEIYNKLKVSFLFDLNREVAIDSYRYGNVERFINHSKKQANCKPSVKLVNGEHRIGFFAMKHLDAGVELFFDYGKAFVEKQGLKEIEDSSKKKIGSPQKSSKFLKGMKDVSRSKGDALSVVENLSNDDDNMMMDDDEQLLAVMRSLSDEDEAEEYVQEEPDVVGRTSRRPRRNVRVPKKYTR